MTKEQRRKMIVKRNAARKISLSHQRRQKAAAQKAGEFDGVPEPDDVLDELPDSLIG